MNGSIVSLNDFKRERGIALPRSPYYTLNATRAQLKEALERGVERIKSPIGTCLPYAVVVGYENSKNGRIKLLKEAICYSSKEAFESMSGISGYRSIALIRNGLSLL